MTGRVWAGEAPAGTRFICIYDRLPSGWSWWWRLLRHPRTPLTVFVPVSKEEAEQIVKVLG